MQADVEYLPTLGSSLTRGLLRMFLVRLAYRSVLSVSSALLAAIWDASRW